MPLYEYTAVVLQTSRRRGHNYNACLFKQAIKSFTISFISIFVMVFASGDRYVFFTYNVTDRIYHCHEHFSTFHSSSSVSTSSATLPVSPLLNPACAPSSTALLRTLLLLVLRLTTPGKILGSPSNVTLLVVRVKPSCSPSLPCQCCCWCGLAANAPCVW